MKEKKLLLRRVLLRMVSFPVLLGLVVLLPAGTYRFWEVYLYFLTLQIPLTITIIYLYRNDKELLKRRMSSREKEPQQKLFILLSSISILGIFIVSGFDHRFHWSSVPLPVVVSADVLVLLAYLFISYVFRTNTFASRVVEVSEEQTLISTGPYAYVRHPMYSGMILLYLATPPALASYLGLIPAALLPFLLILRIANEEKVLKEQLPGYSEYCENVTYRLIPYIW